MHVRTFTFRINANERRILDTLARELQRSQSDTVRWLIRSAARDLLPAEPTPAGAQISASFAMAGDFITSFMAGK